MAWIDGRFMGPVWENHPIDGHPLVGTTHVFGADRVPYDPETDTEPGTLVVGNGMTMEVLAVFRNWNGYKGLDMIFALCYATGLRTHVTPDDLGVIV